MTVTPRPVCLHHCTSEPFQFFGRAAELHLLDQALTRDDLSLIAMIGPGGQGKTAIVQTWLKRLLHNNTHLDGVFLWSFYRGKDADLCLRELYRYAEGLVYVPEVSASFCVDHLLPVLRGERWAVVLDGTEVVQHETGSWYGRFVHPELGRLLEELASQPMPGVVVVTTRFPLPTLERRKRARVVSLASLDDDSALALLRSLGMRGTDAELRLVAAFGGHHAKAVELLGTYLVRFHQGVALDVRGVGGPPAETSNAGEPPTPRETGSDEEARVAQVLLLFQTTLSQEEKDIVALATAFRHPPSEERLLQYLRSDPVCDLLHHTWRRDYVPFRDREPGWLTARADSLVKLRLLERVHSGQDEGGGQVIDAHPLVRRGFEHVLGTGSHREQARARAGFLYGRPDRRPPQSLEEAREEVELFHAYCDAGMWNDADSVLVALDNPKHRFLAPAFERDLLLRFFPHGDFQEKPLWPGFGRYRSLAICFEMLGQFAEALETYRPADAALRGDALIALGQLEPLLAAPQMEQPWQALWQAYRAHALCLAGRVEEAVRLAQTLVPVDVYEWVHVFECLLRADRLHLLDMKSVLYRPPHAAEHRWSQLSRLRMRLDYLRATSQTNNFDGEYRHLLEEYDRGGLPWERSLTRVRYGQWLLTVGQPQRVHEVAQAALEIARRFGMKILEADALKLLSPGR